ncbi:Cell wall transcription factor ACE2 [Candida viswanathii]|uniref:Cell wall transcription factor ACE2 n=1 Tax=Candida viswanathii TaxID=5486 RepID=A0A367YB86_9ASCO|nr:Cell wall transcription factor ACE2 [Candida viswanathii]
MDKFDLFGDYSTKPSTIPLPSDNFDQFLLTSEPNDIEFLFNETLSGLQDLDVPSGYGFNQQQQQQQQQQHPHQQHAYLKSKTHSRQYSGTAIFGFTEHTRDLSINGISNDLYKQYMPKGVVSNSVSPNDLLRETGSTIQQGAPPAQDILNFNFEEKPILLLEQDELEEHEDTQNLLIKSSPIKRLATPTQGAMTQQQQQSQSVRVNGPKQQEYIVTNENPRAYKFPPSPTPKNLSSSPPRPELTNVNSYSAKYLQSLQKSQPQEYVDDIGPLLQNEELSDIKYIPIPVQEPVVYNKEGKRGSIPLEQSEEEDQQEAPQPPQQQQGFPGNFNFNTFLPPPTPPPNLTNGSPDWNSSPEPQSPSPSKLQPNQQISPVHQNLRAMGNNVNFYTPVYYDQQPQPQLQQSQPPQQQQQLPGLRQTYEQIKQIQQQQQMLQQQFHTQQQHQHLQSSPIYNNNNTTSNSSPIKQFTPDTVNNLHVLSPLKNQLPSTPTKQQQQQPHNTTTTHPVTIEWSPVISPNSKSSLSKQLKESSMQSSPRRRIKKTSLLPPGELDNYWVGPDENKIYTCTYKNCFKKFTRRYNVRSHIQTHLSDRPFGCQFCPKRFVRQHDLNRHVKGHIEARYSKCPCGKEFARLDALRKHQDRNICIGGNKGVVSKPGGPGNGVGTGKKAGGVNSSPTKAAMNNEMVGKVDKQLIDGNNPTDEFLVI